MMHFRVDTRSNDRSGQAVLIHKKGSKVVGLHCNPLQPDLLLSCGNDHFVRYLVNDIFPFKICSLCICACVIDRVSLRT